MEAAILHQEAGFAGVEHVGFLVVCYPAIEQAAQQRRQRFGARLLGAHAGHGRDDVVVHQPEMEISPGGNHDFMRQIVLDATLEPDEQIEMTTNADRLPNQVEVVMQIDVRRGK